MLSEVDASVVGLQEVATQAAPGTPARRLEFLAEATGMHPVYGPTLRRRGGEYGNGLLTGLPADEVRRHDLTVPGREPRGVLEVRLAAGGSGLRVVVTHLGLRRRERALQARALWAILRPRAPAEAVVLLADINEWWPWGSALRLLRRGLGRCPAPGTFPSGFPFLALDRVWASPAAAPDGVWTHRTALTRRASDHLPVVAHLRLSPAPVPLHP